MINWHPIDYPAHTIRKNHLPSSVGMGYGHKASAKSDAGIGVPVILKATHDAPSVFFCAVSLTHPFSKRWYIILRLSRVMVAQAGEPQGSPVSFRAGYANPAWATTSEIGVSGGSVTRYLKEAANMATTPIPTHPQFIWLIAAIRRDGKTLTPVIHHIPAISEREARRALVRDHFCFFVGRLLIQGVSHA